MVLFRMRLAAIMLRSKNPKTQTHMEKTVSMKHMIIFKSKKYTKNKTQYISILHARYFTYMYNDFEL